MTQTPPEKPSDPQQAPRTGRSRPMLSCPLQKPVVLVGMMGAGKTRIGRALARRLKIPFHDSDALIEAAAGCAVAEIFARDGETAFRRAEHAVFERLLQPGCAPCVIAAGGGAYIQPAVRDIVDRQAVAVWIDVGLETLCNRLSGSTTRPLLQGGDLRARLETLLQERLPVYRAAAITVQGGQSSPARMVDDIIAQLDRCQGQ